MEKEFNDTKIIELQKNMKNVDRESIKNDYFKSLSYLEDSCELNLRLILKKHLDGIELNEEELEDVSKYVYFSSPILFSGQADGPSSYELTMKKRYGSGNFSDEERTIFNSINNSKKTSPKR